MAFLLKIIHHSFTSDSTSKHPKSLKKPPMFVALMSILTQTIIKSETDVIFIVGVSQQAG